MVAPSELFVVDGVATGKAAGDIIAGLLSCGGGDDKGAVEIRSRWDTELKLKLRSPG